MDDKDPRKFFIPGERKWVTIKGVGRPPGGPDSVSPFPQASLVMCPGPASSSAPAFLCSPTGHCRNLDRCIQGADPRRIPNISPHFLGPTLRTWACYLTMGAMCQVRIAPEGSLGDRSICMCAEWVEEVWGVETNRYGGGAWITWFSFITGQKRKWR